MMGGDMMGSARSWLVFMAALILIGAGFGIGCDKGCSYVHRHVRVNWEP